MGRSAVYPVQQVRAGLPARGDPREGVSTRSAGGRAGDVQERAVQRAWTSAGATRCRSRRKTAPGCLLCVAVCPAKDKAAPDRKALEMAPQAPLRDAERRNYEFFLQLPEADRAKVGHDVKSAQLLEPLFEYSGACAGCGETPYIKLVTQLFGDRAIVANATGCSSIFGGNLPTTPYTTNREGRGPAWANSLFEDNAEFGLGMRLAVDQHEGRARDLLCGCSVGCCPTGS